MEGERTLGELVKRLQQSLVEVWWQPKEWLQTLVGCLRLGVCVLKDGGKGQQLKSVG
jgi:hypothetical protein